MSAGTITLTNNSAAVSGTGTAFTTDLKAGDFIVSVVGGVTYTLPVKTVNSATGVTLLKNYDGPTQAGAAWSAVPRDTMNAITAQLAAEAAQALRGLNYDKQNWQQVFSGTGTVTVKLPDGSSYTGPAWNSLGSAASKDVGTSSGNVMGVGAFGLGLGVTQYPSKLGNVNGFISNNNTTSVDGLPGNGAGIQSVYASTRRGLWWLDTLGIMRTQFVMSSDMPSVQSWRTHWDSGNTTVDSNGFIKKASPIIKIFSDGSFETNRESEGGHVTRESIGVYRINNILGPHSDKAWGGVDGGFEIPKDRNGQSLLWLDYEVDADGSILVKTYHRTYPDAPVFARNIKDGYEESDPIDIPADQFISVRVEMPQDSIWNLAQKAAQEEMAQEEIAEE